VPQGIVQPVEMVVIPVGVPFTPAAGGSPAFAD
jgi:hypothetical protein